MTIKHPLLVLIDGSSYLYRAFHALPPLLNSAGEPTGAIYGVVNMIKKLLNQYQPEHVAVIFDAKGKTFRDDLYADYKATRDAMPDDLVSQVEPLHDLVKAMGLPLLAVEGVEADDVIGTLAVQALEENHHVLISTGDKDMAQLVTDKVTLINTMTNTTMDPAGVETKFGIPPELIIDYLSLVGDTSDNIPGIPGVGPKTAVKWLKEYKTLEGLLKNSDQIKGKVGERLRDNQDKLPLWEQLVTIKKDVALDCKPSELTQGEQNLSKLKELLKHLEFKSWLKSLEHKQDQAPKAAANYKIISDEKELPALVKKLQQAALLGINTKTANINNPFSKLVSLVFSLPDKTIYYLDLASLGEQAVLEVVKAPLESPKIPKLGHGLKKHKLALANQDIHLHGLAYDILIENYLLHATQAKHDIDLLARRFLEKEKTPYEAIAGKGQKQISFDELEIEKASNYACQELDLVADIQAEIYPQLHATASLHKVYDEIELPLISTLAHIEHHGVLVDCDILKKQSDEIEKRLKELEEQIYKAANKVFNVSSPKQLQEVLFEDLKLPISQRTSTGQPSTAEDVLQALALDYPLPKLIIEQRMLSKLKSTYTDALPLQVNPQTGRIHTTYNQAGTSTGRLSSSNPNLQNIPVRNEEGRRIRKAFIAPKGCLLVAADYSQIELRLMAHFSQDKKLLAAFANGTDIHRATAAEVLGVKADDVTPDQRRQAKVINFGILYGMSAFGLAKELGVPREAAQDYINLYFNRYPGVQAYMEKVKKFVHQHGYVETFYGRRIYIPEIRDSNFQRQRAAERAAINGPLQGTAADIIKIAMNSIDQQVPETHPKLRMIMQVHDELVFEAPESDLEASIEFIRKHMTQTIKLSVSIYVDIGKGKNWEEAH